MAVLIAANQLIGARIMFLLASANVPIIVGACVFAAILIAIRLFVIRR
jgi:hypothetical protein